MASNGGVRHDWISIERSFVEGLLVDGQRVWPHQKDFSASLGISPETLCRKIKSCGWDEKRLTFINRATKVRQEKAADLVGAAGAKVDVSAQQAAGRLIAHAVRHLDAAEEKKVEISPNVLHVLARTIATCQQVNALATGAPTVISESNVTTSDTPADLDLVLKSMSIEEAETALRGSRVLRRVRERLAAEAKLDETRH